METLDTPLTRLKKKLEAEIASRDKEIEAFRIERATLRGINDLLKYELASLESVLKNMQNSMDQVKEHVKVLKTNLPPM